MTAEEKEVADDLEWGTLEENKLPENLTEQVKEKSIHDFLRNDGLPRRRVHDYLTDGMKYVTSQMLDRVNEILDRELEEPTWEDEIKGKEDDLLHDYNPAEVMAVEEAKAIEFTFEQRKIHNMVQEYSDIVYTNIKDLNQTNIIKHTIELLDKALIA